MVCSAPDGAGGMTTFVIISLSAYGTKGDGKYNEIISIFGSQCSLLQNRVTMLIQLLDILRIALVAIAFFVGYSIGFGETYDPAAQLHFMIPVVVVAIAGISGLEGLLFGKQAALAKGYETGSNYQKQSSFALLSYAFGALLVYFTGWGIKAEVAILAVFFFFFTLSAVNHGVEAIRHRNYKWQNVNRPFILLLLLAGFAYPVIMLFK